MASGKGARKAAAKKLKKARAMTPPDPRRIRTSAPILPPITTPNRERPKPTFGDRQPSPKE